MENSELTQSTVDSPTTAGQAGSGDAWSAAINTAGNIASLITTGIQNKRARELAEYQYERNILEWWRRYKRQRNDALADYQMQKADALEQWNRQNDYDSVQSQMGRFKSAGLNPNLVYGQMAHGATMQNISAPNSSQGSSPSAVLPHQMPYDFDFGSIVDSYLRSKESASAIRMQEAQRKLVIQQERSLGLSNEEKERNLSHYDEDRVHSLKRARWELIKIQSEVKLTDAQKKKIDDEVALLGFDIEKYEERFQMEKTAANDKHQAALEDSGYKFDANQRANAQSALNTWVAEVKNNEAAVTKRTFENLAWAAYPNPENEAERTYIIKGLYTAENIFTWLEKMLPKFRFERVLKQFQFMKPK